MATSFRRRPKPSEVFAYLHCKDQYTFLAIQEDIFLRIADIVTEGGTGFAFPSQTTYFGRDSGVNAERARETEAKVEDWREHDRLPFPEFDPSLRRQTENVLDYPQRGGRCPRPQTPKGIFERRATGVGGCINLHPKVHSLMHCAPRATGNALWPFPLHGNPDGLALMANTVVESFRNL